MTQPPRPLPDHAEALAVALGLLSPAPCGSEPEGAGEGSKVSIPSRQALGRTLRSPIVADRDQPPFDRATMDGYALRHVDLASGRALPVIGAIAAGDRFERQVPPGTCVAIATGAAVPEELDTVIQHELLENRALRRGAAAEVSFADAVPRGHAIHPRGADARSGAVLVAAGTRLRPFHLGLAAAVGATRLSTARPPRVAVITSGDEIVAPETPAAQLAPVSVRNSNAPMLESLIGSFGGEVVECRHVADDLEATQRALRHAAATAEVLVTVGGVSAGAKDFFPEALASLGVRFAVRGARLQPGGPIAIGSFGEPPSSAPRDGRTDRSAPPPRPMPVAAPEGPSPGARVRGGPIVLCLPGNPVSAHVCACLFLWPLLRRLLGGDPTLPWRPAQLLERVRPNPARQAFRAARCAPTSDPGGVRVLGWQGSGDLAHLAASDGLVALPIQPEPVEPGTTVRFLAWSELGA
ncbi:MAG TPA: molybdopterin molybdotransferase MoeA [Phycisphaerales bacterium]|mgnify:CR=1 FL=1|nr:molybdopterin molybdotransferase MoeA [Phycisphaerales bacterium]HMP38122.1 molybdopterin molybdotransferase MoeA [Phycisphaerales bacterium]